MGVFLIRLPPAPAGFLTITTHSCSVCVQDCLLLFSAKFNSPKLTGFALGPAESQANVTTLHVKHQFVLL